MKAFIFALGATLLVCACSCQKGAAKASNRRADSTLVGPIVNPDFEANGPTETPTGWSTTGNAAASYTQQGGYSGKYCLTQYAANAYQVYTYQTVTGIENGTYVLTAWTQNSGGQNFCYLNATSYGGGSERMTSLPVSSTWTQVIIRGIQVTNGQLTIGLNSDAMAGNWAKLDGLVLTKDGVAYSFLKGGDVSELSYLESMGAKFYQNGVLTDCFTILKNNGFNIVRLRLYNDPGNAGYSPSNLLPAGFQNPSDILNLAKRAKAAGMEIELTFHYSDYWTNGTTQYKPHDWANLSYADLQTAVYNFTYSFINQMKAQGTTPEFVSLGNESVGGILFPDGSNGSNFTNLAQLSNQGYNAVKAVSPSTKVIIHLDDAGNSAKYDWYFPAFITAGGKFDIIGASYYPFWTNRTVAQIRDWANVEFPKYNKPFMIMETGFNWNPTLPDGSTGQLTNNGPYGSIYPTSPEGQKNFLYECFNGLKAVNNGAVLGDLYWDPVMISAPGVGWELGQPNVVSNATLFDFGGNILSSFKAFQYNN